MYHKNAEFSELVGKTLAWVENVKNEEIVFTTVEGEVFKLYHDQDCCESVTVEDITGDLMDLLGTPILKAEESSNVDRPPPPGVDSYTWTFYLLATVRGYVTIRWLGDSNGYYSERVDFARVK